MNDTTRRFLSAVVERIPEERIVELRLFPAIRQGGIESGVAVLAVEPEVDASSSESGDREAPDVAALPPALPDAALVNDDALERAVLAEVVAADAAVTEDGESLSTAPVRSVASHVHVTLPPIEDDASDSDRPATLQVARDAMPPAAEAEVGATSAMSEKRRDVEAPLDVTTETDPLPLDAMTSVALDDMLALPPVPPSEAPMLVASQRVAVITARYRLIVKGPERGKWDMELIHQADAPLDAVERVIRGVVRRSGEDYEPDRFTGTSLREALAAPAWLT